MLQISTPTVLLEPFGITRYHTDFLLRRCCAIRTRPRFAAGGRDADAAVCECPAYHKEVDLPGFEAAVSLDFGDTGCIAKVPEGTAFDC